ncbi:putative Malectin domain-containing protein [Helianthus anomalus]
MAVHQNDLEDLSMKNYCHPYNISTSDTKLFINARTTAVSLTYYGLCLLNGNYNLTLYFAEIVFSQDKSYNSLGKRVFDVCVQVIQLLDIMIE